MLRAEAIVSRGVPWHNHIGVPWRCTCYEACVPQGVKKAFKKGKVEGDEMDVDAFFRQVG